MDSNKLAVRRLNQAGLMLDNLWSSFEEDSEEYKIIGRAMDKMYESQKEFEKLIKVNQGLEKKTADWLREIKSVVEPNMDVGHVEEHGFGCRPCLAKQRLESIINEMEVALK